MKRRNPFSSFLTPSLPPGPSPSFCHQIFLFFFQCKEWLLCSCEGFDFLSVSCSIRLIPDFHWALPSVAHGEVKPSASPGGSGCLVSLATCLVICFVLSVFSISQSRRCHGSCCSHGLWPYSGPSETQKDCVMLKAELRFRKST